MMFCERLKNERIKAGLSQKDFSKKLGLNCRTYASYERGERDVSTALLLKICLTLNISSDTLLGNDSNDSNDSKEKPPSSDVREQLETICDTMPEDMQKELLKYAKYLHTMQQSPEIVEQTTIGAELDRRAATDAEAKKTAV